MLFRSLDRDIALLRDKAGDLIETHVRDQFGKEAAEHASVHYSSRVDAGWIQNIAEYGRRIFQDQASVPSYIAARGRLKSAIVDDMFDRFADDTDTLRSCVDAFQRLTTIETDIILAQVALLEAIDAADVRGRESDQFERRVADLVRASTEQSKALTDRTRSTASSARGMPDAQAKEEPGTVRCSLRFNRREQVVDGFLLPALPADQFAAMIAKPEDVRRRMKPAEFDELDDRLFTEPFDVQRAA